MVFIANVVQKKCMSMSGIELQDTNSFLRLSVFLSISECNVVFLNANYAYQGVK